MTPPEFAHIWVSLLRSYPAAKPTEGTSLEYARRLAAFEVAEVAAAVNALILECDFMPSIAQVWQRCVDARDRAPSWEQAWEEAQLHASGTDLPWAHEAAREAARTIGLYEIRSSNNPATTRAQFRDVYQSILKRRRQEFASSDRALPAVRRLELEGSS